MTNRREAIERLTLILGGALSPQLAAGVMGQVINGGESLKVNEATIQLLTEAADLIIPTTDTPGAKAAGAEKFIIRVMRDCYEIAEQKKFYGGLEKLDRVCREKHGKGFVDLDLKERTSMLEAAAKDNRSFFRQLRQLTVTGYFTSEIGATQALAYLPVPGKFVGDVPMEPNQKAWAISR